MSSFTVEFPAFDTATMPVIPENWIDVSYHNDACPSFDTQKGLIVFVDFEDLHEREFFEGERFNLINSEDCDDTVFSSDDWKAVLDFVAAYRSAEMRKEAIADALSFISQLDSRDELTIFGNTWLDTNGYQPMSWDELYFEMSEGDNNREVVQALIGKWEELTERDGNE
jgi:hypothetical protein